MAKEVVQVPKRIFVLVVDDDPSIRLLNRLLLEALGHQCIEAKDGESALSLLRNVKFAAVISDLNMPGMDGLELLLAMKREGFLDNTPVIMVSSETNADTKYLALCYGAKYYLPKPLQKELLRVALEGIRRNP